MSFTNTDLERMKNAVSDPALFPTIWVGDVQALISRLEAAEKCVNDCLADENCCEAWPVVGPSHAELWRKSKGEVGE